VIQVIEERKFAYRKLIVRDHKLIGAMLVGETRAAASLIQTFDRGDALPSDPLEAFCSFAAAGPGAGAAQRVICNCHKVSEEAIVQCIAAGAGSVDAIGDQTRAGTGCGSCRSDLTELVRVHKKPAKLAASA
jgi:nitrite reductase (NADH) large subunit